MTKQNVNQNASNVIPFDFRSKEVRTVVVNAEPWFVANDVATALGYRDAEKMTRWLDGDEKGTHNVGTPGGEQNLSTINESGLYHALFKSRKPEAQPFRKWVTGTVLPAIRKTGQYIAPRETLTPDQKRTIQEAVAERAAESADFQRIYSKLKTKFRVAKYDEILSSQFEEALAFIESIELKPKGVPAMAGTRWLGHMDHQGQMHMKALEKDSTILPVSKWPDYIRTEHVDESIILDMLKACTAQMDRIVSYQQGKIKELKAV